MRGSGAAVGGDGDGGVDAGATATRRAGSRARIVAAALVRVAWITALGLSLLLAVWLLRVGEETQLGWLLSSATHLVLLAAWLPLAVAVVARRRLLGAAAGVLVVAQLALVWPMLPWSGRAPEGAAATLRLRALNVYVDNHDVDALAAEVLAERRDVISLTELTPAARDALVRAGVEHRYPYRVDRAAPGTVGSAVYSRLPIEEVGEPTPELSTFRLRLPDGKPVRLFVVHLFPPAGDDQGAWARSLEDLDAAMGRAPGAFVAIGDYNATLDHRAYRDLLGGGRTDAHLATGRGLARSWPASGALLPPLFLIDRAILAPGVVALRTAEHTVPGSDHRMLDVDVVA